MMFSADDVCSTVSAISSAFTDDIENEDDQQEPREMKYVPVKTEVDELIPLEATLTEDDIDDHFLNSFSSNDHDTTTDAPARDDDEFDKPRRRARRKLDPDDDLDDVTWSQKKPKKKKPSQGTARRGGKRKQMSRQEKNALSQRQKRALMSPEEKEKLREKWKLEKQRARGMEKHRRLEEENLRDLVAEDADNDQKDETLTLSRSSRPTRRARLKPAIKDEPESADDFNDEDDHDDDFKIEKSKKTSTRKSSGGSSKDDQKVKTEKKGGCATTGKGKKSAGGSGSVSRRKKIADMESEEREAIKAKWREEARLKRARQRESMAPEQREEYLRVQREKRREQRAMAKGTLSQEEYLRVQREKKREKRAMAKKEDREEVNRKARERKRAQRAQMTPEQRKEELQKLALRRIQKAATMTETEKTEYRMRRYMEYISRVSKMTNEQQEERRQAWKRRREQMSADELERRRLKSKAYRAALSPERKAKFLEYKRQRWQQLKTDPQKWEKVKAKWKEYRLKSQKKMAEMGVGKRNGEISKRRVCTKPDPNETAEQRAERRWESKLINQRKTRLKKRLALQKLLESGINPEEIELQVQTPEQRERRLIRARIGRAKWAMRKRLKAVGASPEEIQQKLSELEQSYQPIFQFKPYKPRPRAWKPIDPNELALLEVNNETEQDITAIIASTPATATPKIEIVKPKLPATSKAPTTIGRGGRSLKNVQQQQSQAGETPEPVSYATSPPQQYFSTNIYTTAQCHSQTPASQPYSLQHILDGITYQQSGTTGPSIISYQSQYQQQVVHHHHDNSSSYADDYDASRSYDNHSPPAPSPPRIPAEGGDDHDISTAATFSDFSSSGGTRQPPPSYSTADSASATRGRGRPRKDEPPRPKKQTGPKPGPRGAPKNRNTSDAIPVTVCEECGNSYRKTYIKTHQLQFHNPNYRDKKCLLCGEKFKLARHWYRHYIQAHQEVPKDKPHMCDICGLSFKQKGNLGKHKYYMHGDGLKPENFKKCPLCPSSFKEQISLNSHIRKRHPGYNYHKRARCCYRCDQCFPTDVKLSLHVQQEHPESFYPCQHCKGCRFTELGLAFHTFRCTKISRTARDQLKKAPGAFILEEEPLSCEFCEEKVPMTDLTRHYWDVHNVKEDMFTCAECDKDFRVREFWAIHMEEKHGKTLEQVKDLVRCLNVTNREGLVINNPGGEEGGVHGNTTPSKVASEKTVESRVTRTTGRQVKSKVAKKKILTRIHTGAIIVVAEEEEQLRLERASKTANEAGKKGGRKPGSKPTAKTKKYEESEEEEEDNWRGSDDDCSDEQYRQPTQRGNSTGERRSSARKSTRTFRESDSSASEDDADDRPGTEEAVVKQEIE